MGTWDHLETNTIMDITGTLDSNEASNILNGCTFGVRGFSNRDEGDRIIKLIRLMGGRSKGYITVSHKFIITGQNCSRALKGDRTELAIISGLKIVKKDWVDFCWEHRSVPGFDPFAPNVIDMYELKVFTSLKIAFFNFPSTEMPGLMAQTNRDGGQVVDITNPEVTHIVVDAIHGEQMEDEEKERERQEKETKGLSCLGSLPNLCNIDIVYKEWFWESVLRGRQDEATFSYPVFGCRNNRKSISCLSRRSLLLSPGLDYDNSPFTSPCPLPVVKTNQHQQVTLSKGTNVTEGWTKRRHVAMEFLNTERNYRHILRTLINVFGKPLEDFQYLDATEHKHIFGYLYPLLEVHEQITHDLEQLIEHNWHEDNLIGEVFIKYHPLLLKSYPPFCNFHESTKETITQCEQKNPLFHAFLKKCESHPDCKRQSFRELLIIPVQRVFGYSMLLDRIIEATRPKVTDATTTTTISINPDADILESAKAKVAEILTHMNEDKRKTEGQMAMFEIVQEIEDCPPSILSSKRNLVCRLDGKLIINDHIKGTPCIHKGHTFTIFLFNDMIQICKKRTVKRADSVTSRSSAKSTVSNVTFKSPKKMYRHIDMIEMVNIKYMVDIPSGDHGYDDCIMFQSTEIFDSKGVYKIIPFIPTGVAREFLTKMRRIPGMNPAIFIDGDFNNMTQVDFQYADHVASKMTKSTFGKAKASISRTFSMSKKLQSSANLLPSSPLTSSATINEDPTDMTHYHPKSSTSTLNRGLTSSPRLLSSSLLSKFKSPFQSPRFNLRRMSSTSLWSLNEGSKEPGLAHGALGHDDTFSLPSTPAPKKKKCPQPL